MRILFLTYDLPYPLNAGGKIRAYNLLKSLSEKHQITLFSWYRNEEQKKYLGEVRKLCQEVILVKRDKPWCLRNLASWLFSSLPFPAATYYSSLVKNRLIKEMESQKFDVIHFESFYPAWALPLAKRRGITTVLGNENIEHRVYQRYAQSRKLRALKCLLLLEVLRIKRYEEKLWRLADFNLAPSAIDAREISKFSRNKCQIIPNGATMPNTRLDKPEKNRNTIIFIGSLVYQANNDAVKYFLSEIYPLLKKNNPKMKFILVSWHKPKWLNHFLKDNSIEFLPDTKTTGQELIKQGDCLVAPIRIASGTNIKILEALAVGVPVVTTTMGAEGLEKIKNNLIIADKPVFFAKTVEQILGNRRLRAKIALEGQRAIKKYYDWSKIGVELLSLYAKIENEKKD